MTAGAPEDVREIPSLCFNCVAGPCFMTARVENGIATRIEPNHAAEEVHPGRGRVCVKAMGLVQKTYNPHRVLTPMKRTNPQKGREEDPGFVPVSWDEALNTIAERLRSIRDRGLLDEAGLPRLAATFGNGGTPQSYMGTFPAFLSAWGPIDFSFGSGQGVKCTHSEHLYGEYWHRAFTVSADTPLTRYIVSFGANVEVTGGVCAVRRHADARVRGIKRVQIEPHLSPTGACSAEWVPVKPKTDSAFLLAMIHTLLFEVSRDALDLQFLRDRTASPYLIGSNGYYLRDLASGKPLIWDTNSKGPVPFDTESGVPALEGTFPVGLAVTHGPDGEVHEQRGGEARTAFTAMAEAVRIYAPEWAAGICDVPAKTIRRIALEYLENACIGQTIEIDDQTLPFRPVAISLGKTVNNGWGAYECCWARTVLATLVGALEVPGGILGTTVRLNRPHENRLLSVKPGTDGFMAATLNATEAGKWVSNPTGRNAHRSLVPILGNSPWAQALGPTQLSWMFLRKTPEGWPEPTLPEMWFVFRANPAISFWDTRQLADTMAKMPFIVSFAYTLDETNHMADILLPDATDLESTQLIRVGGTGPIEQYWQHRGYALRQKAVEPQGHSRDFTWISTELARRTGLLEAYNAALNRGAGGVPLKGDDFDYSLPVDVANDADTIWDTACRAATAKLTNGKDVKDLAWFKKHGSFLLPFKCEDWYLYPTMVRLGLRFELPYQERLMRVGEELRRRLHEKGVHWWDSQLSEYMPIPLWHDVPGRWLKAIEGMGADPGDYPFWAVTTKLMAYTVGNNAGHTANARGGTEPARPRRGDHERRHGSAPWYRQGRLG